MPASRKRNKGRIEKQNNWSRRWRARERMLIPFGGDFVAGEISVIMDVICYQYQVIIPLLVSLISLL